MSCYTLYFVTRPSAVVDRVRSVSLQAACRLRHIGLRFDQLIGVRSDGVVDSTQELKPGVRSVVKSGETCLNAGSIQQVRFEF